MLFNMLCRMLEGVLFLLEVLGVIILIEKIWIKLGCRNISCNNSIYVYWK